MGAVHAVIVPILGVQTAFVGAWVWPARLNKLNPHNRLHTNFESRLILKRRGLVRQFTSAEALNRYIPFSDDDSTGEVAAHYKIFDEEIREYQATKPELAKELPLSRIRHVEKPSFTLDMTKHRYKVWLDIEVGGEEHTMEFQLYNDVLPLICYNFKTLCAGDFLFPGQSCDPFTYKWTRFHRVTTNLSMLGGDINSWIGYGGETVTSARIHNEGFYFKHSRRGLLTTAPHRIHEHSSLFQIMFGPAPQLDGLSEVFGHLCSDHTVLDELEKFGTVEGAPAENMNVKNCGVIDDGGFIYPRRRVNA